MKEKELREIAKCAFCGKKFGESRLPLFWRVRVQRYGLKVDAIQRQQGLTMLLGGHAQLAQVMGTDADMAEKISENEITVCESCCTARTCVGELAEKE